jgi:hypothetical protein
MVIYASPLFTICTTSEVKPLLQYSYPIVRETEPCTVFWPDLATSTNPFTDDGLDPISNNLVFSGCFNCTTRLYGVLGLLCDSRY